MGCDIYDGWHRGPIGYIDNDDKVTWFHREWIGGEVSKRPLPLPDPDLSDFTCTPEQQFWGDVEVLILMSLVVAVILLALILPWKGVLQCR